MSRDPSQFFSYIFPDRRDPNREKWDYLCRYCGKSTEHTRRRFYCSTECFDLCQKAVSWASSRYETWLRDNKKCVECGDNVELNSGGWKLVNDEWVKIEKPASVAEIHHVIPVKILNEIIYETIFKNTEWDDVDYDTKIYWRCRFYAMLYLDINNLITLCEECHNKKHSKGSMKKLEIERNHKPLDLYFES